MVNPLGGKGELAQPASGFPFEGAKVTILNDVLRRGKSNLYSDKIYHIFSLIDFALRFSRLILTLNIHNICGPFTFQTERDLTSICHCQRQKNELVFYFTSAK